MFIILFNMMYYYNFVRILNMDYEYISSRKISDFFQNLQKFEICKSYILLISLSENIFKGIFLLRGSRRMGKSCQHIMLCFLVHPSNHELRIRGYVILIHGSGSCQDIFL
jgi:hypothetical protein